MCGIFGAFSFGKGGVPEATVRAMSRSVRHRGPDADGFHQDDIALLGNRRLAIIDLTQASDQPLYSDDSKIIVVQNGEIYNFIELRAELERNGARFATQGDTEVILRAYERWGPGFVERLNGMFAIAIYDARSRKMFLYRDRMGVKPLYVAGSPDEGRIWFASEIKTILQNGLSYPPNLDAFAQYFALNYIPAPATAFSGISHVPPAHYCEISQASGITFHRYWDLSRIEPERDMSEAEASARLLVLLDDATRIRMRSDAPFGAFLSGGLDSSSVVGFMSLYQASPVHTFSIGFEDSRFDETDAAREASRRFGTMHVVQLMQPAATQMWPTMIWHCDQPHGDVSFMPMLQVAQLASRDVKMVLTGDGGDELFGGYEKYLPVFPEGRPVSSAWDREFVTSSGLLQSEQADILLSGHLRDSYRANDPYRALTDAIADAERQDPINQMLYAETVTLLPGNNLVKPDRMAMAHSLEVRSPFLDYRMAEFAFQVPGGMKLRDGETKWIYKRAVEPLLGRALTHRRKQMFTVPIGEWFRQALSHYCRDILLDGRLESRAIVSRNAVEQLLAEHIKGTQNHTRILRALISLELWYRLFVDGDQDLRAHANGTLELAA